MPRSIRQSRQYLGTSHDLLWDPSASLRHSELSPWCEVVATRMFMRLHEYCRGSNNTTPACSGAVTLPTQHEHAAMRWKSELPDTGTIPHHNPDRLGSSNALWKTPLVRAEGLASIRILNKKVFFGLRAAAWSSEHAWPV